MHKRESSFNPLKFTPSYIHNKINIPIHELIDYFMSHSLKECAEQYDCSVITIKRKLRAAGIDTSLHNHSCLAVERYHQTIKKVPSEQELKQLYIDDNLDTKTIAELFGLHYQTIRNRTKKYYKSREAIQQSMMNRHFLKYGVRHPSQRPDILKKTSVSLNKAIYNNYCFKSLSELAFALLLNKTQIKWYYEEMQIPYVNMITGKYCIYVIDFTIEDGNKIEWIEVKPQNSMIPEDKRIYASRRAEDCGIIYRGLTDKERIDSWRLIVDGYDFDKIEFIQQKPRASQNKITYYFKNKDAAYDFELPGWRQFTKPDNDGALWKKTLVRK